MAVNEDDGWIAIGMMMTAMMVMTTMMIMLMMTVETMTMTMMRKAITTMNTAPTTITVIIRRVWSLIVLLDTMFWERERERELSTISR